MTPPQKYVFTSYTHDPVPKSLMYGCTAAHAGGGRTASAPCAPIAGSATGFRGADRSLARLDSPTRAVMSPSPNAARPNRGQGPCLVTTAESRCAVPTIAIANVSS